MRGIRLKDLAASVGLPEDFTPSPPTARDAWRKATHTGKRGLKVPKHHINQSRVRQARRYRRDEPEPRVFLRSVEISRSAPVLRRHLVLFAVVPSASDKDEQLELGSVAVLEFNCDTLQAHAYVDTGGQDWVDRHYINDVIHDQLAAMRDYMDRADNNKIRASVRDLLEGLHRVCLRNTGGVYFVPRSAAMVVDNTVLTATDGLQAMKDWVNGLGRYAEDDPPVFRSVILDGQNAKELHGDIATSALNQFKGDLQNVADSLRPVFDGRVLGRTAIKVVANAQGNVYRLIAGAKAYRESLLIDLSELDAMFKMAESALKKAQDLAFDTASDEDLALDGDDES